VTRRIITIPLLLIAAALGAGCGADEETKPSIPADQASELLARLSEVERRFDVGGGACEDITNDSQPAVDSILASLPSSVDSDVRGAVTESFDRLFELTAEDCKDEQETTTPTETETVTTETETTETTETTPTETTPTETVPTETTTTETTPTTPEDGDGGGAGPGL
jgi:hypothetical protein